MSGFIGVGPDFSIYKDPDAVLDYTADWSKWLTKLGDTAGAFEWIVPDGITKDDEGEDATTSTVWLSGGAAGESYVVTSRITTTGGRTDDRSFTVIVRHR